MRKGEEGREEKGEEGREEKGEEGREGKGDRKGRGRVKGERDDEEVAEEGKGEASEWGRFRRAIVSDSGSIKMQGLLGKPSLTRLYFYPHCLYINAKTRERSPMKCKRHLYEENTRQM